MYDRKWRFCSQTVYGKIHIYFSQLDQDNNNSKTKKKWWPSDAVGSLPSPESLVQS